MFGKKKEKQGFPVPKNQKPDKNALKKQKKSIFDEDEHDFEDLMEELDEYN